MPSSGKSSVVERTSGWACWGGSPPRTLPGCHRQEQVDFIMSAVELDARARRVAGSVLQKLLERRRDSLVERGRLSPNPFSQVAPAGKRPALQAEGFRVVALRDLDA